MIGDDASTDQTRPASTRARRYLLGGLSETERARLEEAYFSDAELFAEVLAAEGELMEDYIEGRLSEDERRAFEGHVLSSPRRRQSVAIAESLMRSAARISPGPLSPERRPPRGRSRPGVARWVWAVGPAAAAVGILWIAGAVWPERSAHPERRSVEAPTSGTEVPERPEAARPKTLPVRVVRLTLTPGLLRDAGRAQEIALPYGTDVVRLELDLAPADHSSYHAILRTAEGTLVWEKPGLRTERAGGSRQLVAEVPGRLLQPADYIVILRERSGSGVPEDAAEYFFRVLKADRR